MSYNKYYKQKKQISYDYGQTWQDITPYQYQKGALYEEDSPDCTPPPGPIYRWVNMDISTDWICYGTTKYYKQKKQVSNDNGQTWQDVIPYEYQSGSIYETESTDCGYVPPIYRWVNMDISTDYICDGTTKYYKQKKQISFDGGQTWQDVTPAEYQRGSIYEAQSTDCGYVPPASLSDYLTFVPLEDCQFSFSGNVTSVGNNIYRNSVFYSIDSGATWTSIGGVLGRTEYTPTVKAGKEIWWKRDFKYSGEYGRFSSTQSTKFNVRGNIMSLVSANDFSGLTSVGSYYFGQLFEHCYIVDASQLLLPATDLGKACYSYMFHDCSELIKAPNLPATVLKEKCYSWMFAECTSLTNAPILLAQTLVKECYDHLFYSSTEYMSLNNIKCFATDLSAQNCLNEWMAFSTYQQSTGTFTKAAGVNWPTGENGIPEGWTVIDA